MAKNACGPQTEIASNNIVRVTRCTCGILHVTLLANGVTVRMTAEQLRGASGAFTAAIERIEEPVEFSSTGSTSIN
jgi:fructose-specific phosphotransferase system component IIB